MFSEGLWTPHVGSEVWIRREPVTVLAGLGALQGKVDGELLPSDVQSVLLEVGEGHLIAGVGPVQDDGKCLLLNHLYISALFLNEGPMEHWCSKFEGGANTSLEDLE